MLRLVPGFMVADWGKRLADGGQPRLGDATGGASGHDRRAYGKQSFGATSIGPSLRVDDVERIEVVPAVPTARALWRKCLPGRDQHHHPLCAHRIGRGGDAAGRPSRANKVARGSNPRTETLAWQSARRADTADNFMPYQGRVGEKDRAQRHAICRSHSNPPCATSCTCRSARRPIQPQRRCRQPCRRSPSQDADRAQLPAVGVDANAGTRIRLAAIPPSGSQFERKSWAIPFAASTFNRSDLDGRRGRSDQFTSACHRSGIPAGCGTAPRRRGVATLLHRQR